MIRTDVASPAITSDGADEVISDETTRLILVAIGVVLVAAVAVVMFVTGARWAAADDVEQPWGNVDIGFLQDMTDHHRQALLISTTYLDNNPDGGAAPYAREVVQMQRHQIRQMAAWLADAGVLPGAPDRRAMTWMGMPSPIGDMPGMQPPARVAQLAAASGAAADRLFFELMSDHHLGGAGMADAAAVAARRPEIRDFAAKMADNQRIEVIEYRLAVERLGL